MAKMKELPTDDPLFGKGSVRADGRKMHDMYLFEVKKPGESKGPWDYYKQISPFCRPSRPSARSPRASARSSRSERLRQRHSRSLTPQNHLRPEWSGFRDASEGSGSPDHDADNDHPGFAPSGTAGLPPCQCPHEMI